MSVSRVGGAVAATTSVTIPAHAVGDLMVILAWRSASSTAPTIPAGWNQLGVSTQTGATKCWVGLFYKYATATNDTSGTWTSASGLACAVYRGAGPPAASDASVNSGVSTAITYLALTISDPGNSWLAALAGAASAGANTAPGALAAAATNAATVGAYDSNGVRSTNWAQTTVTVSSEAWGTAMLEVSVQPSISDTGLSLTDSLVAAHTFIRAAADTGLTLSESTSSLRLRSLADTGLTLSEAPAVTVSRPLADAGAAVSDSAGLAVTRPLNSSGATLTDSILATTSGGGPVIPVTATDRGIGPVPVLFGPLG